MAETKIKPVNRDGLKAIKKYCENPKLSHLSDREITQRLIKQKKFSKYAGLEEGFSIDTLRRSISFVRNYFNLRAEKFPNLKKVFKEYQRLIKENPEATNVSIAIKLNFLFPQYKVKTFKVIIANYKTYGIFST